MTFFDCSPPIERDGLIIVDRVYRLAWVDFNEQWWDALGDVYPQLPGWKGPVPQDRLPGWRGWLGQRQEMPFWFGTSVHRVPHLTTSVEPPGLQVSGTLSVDDFRRWHDAFVLAIAEFPTYEPE